MNISKYNLVTKYLEKIRVLTIFTIISFESDKMIKVPLNIELLPNLFHSFIIICKENNHKYATSFLTDYKY